MCSSCARCKIKDQDIDLKEMIENKCNNENLTPYSSSNQRRSSGAINAVKSDWVMLTVQQNLQLYGIEYFQFE